MGLTIRTLVPDDSARFQRLVNAAFLSDVDEEHVGRWHGLFEAERHHGVFDGDELIGGGGIQSREMTLPGAGPQAVAAVTSVVVRPGHRRRGVLNMVMRAQLHGLHEQAREPLAALWASEAAIYGRYGYGYAADFLRLSVPARAEFLPHVSVGDERVREAPRQQAMPVIKELYERVRPHRTGWLSRDDAMWEYRLRDEERDRHGRSAYRYVLHPRGYAVYRVTQDWQERGPRHQLYVRELAAEDAVAFAALYRYLLDVDLVGELQLFTAADDPVVHLLADSRLALRSRADSLWVRLVDVDRALALRRYQSDVDVVLEVSDELCPWNAGTWRMTVKGGEAVVRRTSDAPDLAMDVRALGAAYLGGTRLTVLGAAQAVHERSAGALAALSHAFLGDREPHCPEVF
ncbi:GNAT family N-acetyltransferase [Saccharothrix coeruleofusca]|uniref:UPF0256 protein n=1 Tax=Saccharothrix coeruleofusca TaxID=33919 RepID=A0A918AKY6_9PSEU|nr:GNAT family N-acetyltransferase [Saccharothrix coeruleofusca]GGP43072.1 UPF0256 protein [Saccharothrix coeruleofusca]